MTFKILPTFRLVKGDAEVIVNESCRADFEAQGYRIAPEAQADPAPFSFFDLGLSELKGCFAKAAAADVDLPQPGGRWGPKKYATALAESGWLPEGV